MQTWQKLKQNPDLFPRYFVKEYTIRAIRKFFENRGYHELESPVLSDALPSEAHLDPLSTTIELSSGKKHKAYLIPSTETFNKKILAAGLGNHFVISKVFRALEEISPNHSPEFTMLEWYALGADYRDLMEQSEDLVLYIKQFLDEKFETQFTTEITYQNNKTDISKPWLRLSIKELFQKIFKIDLSELYNLKDLKHFADKKNYIFNDNDDWQNIFEMIFATEIEPTLPIGKPLFLYDYPKVVCPLTKTSDKDPEICEKVELYIAGKEIANGYSELIDGEELEKRLRAEYQKKQELGKETVEFDTELIKAVKSGIPEVAGIGLGIDRLAMILANAKSIADINYFPASEMFK